MLLELFPFVILNNAIAFVYAYFFSDFLRFDMSLLLLTVTMRGYLINIAYCLFFHLICLVRSHKNHRWMPLCFEYMNVFLVSISFLKINLFMFIHIYTFVLHLFIPPMTKNYLNLTPLRSIHYKVKYMK